MLKVLDKLKEALRKPEREMDYESVGYFLDAVFDDIYAYIDTVEEMLPANKCTSFDPKQKELLDKLDEIRKRLGSE